MGKKAVTGLCAFFLALSLSAQEQDYVIPPRDTTDSPLILKGDLFSPVYSFKDHFYLFAIAAERPFGRRQSLQITCYAGGSNRKYGDWDETQYLIGLIPDYKIFVRSKRQCSGYYLGISAAYARESFRTAVHASGADRLYFSLDQYVGAGAINGWQFYLGRHFTTDILVGVIWLAEIDKSLFREPDWEVYPRVAINIGYRF